MSASQFGAGEESGPRYSRTPRRQHCWQRRPAAVRPNQGLAARSTSACHFGAQRSLATLDLTRSIFRRICQRYFRIIRGVETGDIEPAAATASIFWKYIMTLR